MQEEKKSAASPPHAAEQAPNGANPFARAAKRQAQVCSSRCYKMCYVWSVTRYLCVCGCQLCMRLAFDLQEPRLANHALPAVPAKAAANHLSTTDIASVLKATPSSHRVEFLASVCASDCASYSLWYDSHCVVS